MIKLIFSVWLHVGSDIHQILRRFRQMKLKFDRLSTSGNTSDVSFTCKGSVYTFKFAFESGVQVKFEGKVLACICNLKVPIGPSEHITLQIHHQ